MVDDAMKGDRIIGMVQPKKNEKSDKLLYNVGCAGKITSFHETEDGRYLIVIVGISRFKILEELNSSNLYRECKISFNDFLEDLKKENDKEKIQFSDLKLIFKNFKTLLDKEGYQINWKEIEKQSLDLTINTLSMASPFSLEEKQILLETNNLSERKTKLEEILKNYLHDNYKNSTIQ